MEASDCAETCDSTKRFLCGHCHQLFSTFYRHRSVYFDAFAMQWTTVGQLRATGIAENQDSETVELCKETCEPESNIGKCTILWEGVAAS